MSLNDDKIEIIKLLLEVEDINVLNKVRAILTDEHIFYEDLPEHVKAGINRSLEEYERGECRDHEVVMKEMRSKYDLGHNISIDRK